MDRISTCSSGYSSNNEPTLSDYDDSDVSSLSSARNDSEIDAEIAAYDLKQLKLAGNDRLAQIQHANSRLAEPINYRETPHLPRTALERQQLEAIQIRMNVQHGASRSSMMSQGIWNDKPAGERKVSLLQESSKAGQGMRKASLAKRQIHKVVLIPPETDSTTSESDEESSIVSSVASSDVKTSQQRRGAIKPRESVTPPKPKLGAAVAVSPHRRVPDARFKKWDRQKMRVRDSLAVHKQKKQKK